MKWIMRSLRGTADMKLGSFVGYSEEAGDIDSRKSTSGYFLTFAGLAI